MSGKHKFGTDNIACSDYYVQVSKKYFEIKKIINIKNDTATLDEFCQKVIDKKFKNKNVICFKSSQVQVKNVNVGVGFVIKYTFQACFQLHFAHFQY